MPPHPPADAEPPHFPLEGTGAFLPTEVSYAADPVEPGPALAGTVDLPSSSSEDFESSAPVLPRESGGGEMTAASLSTPHSVRQSVLGTVDLVPEHVSDPPSAGPGTLDYDPSASTANFPRDAGNGPAAGTYDYEPAADTADPASPVGGGGGRSGYAETGMHNPAGAVLFIGPPAPLSGRPRYDLKKVHARGGMGEVWLAEDTGIGRVVALKKMRPQLKGKGKEDTFLWEAQVTGQLEHPGVVPVHELGSDAGGDPYYVMKFVHGSTMLEELEAFHAIPKDDPRREVERLRLLQVFLALCQTIAYAHSRGVIHRDIKPENVMVGEYGETLVLDWGLAKLIGEDEHAEKGGPVRRSYSGESYETIAGSIKGTPWYMAPEVAAGDVKSVDQISDVFLLGATMYHLITGQRPRQGKTLPELISAAHRPPIPPRTHDPSLPKPLESICLKAMAVERGDRYQSAKALAEDLQRYLAGETVSAYRETLTERAWRWMRRHRRALGRVAAAVALLGISGFVWAKYVEFKEREEESRIAHVQELEEAGLRLKQTEEERATAAKTAAALQQQKDAKEKLAQFRKLAEEVRFLIASTNPVAAQAPYFNPQAGLFKGEEVLALAAPWGDDLSAFTLADERPAVGKDVADLLLLLAQLRMQSPGPEPRPDVLAMLDRAARLQGPTRSYHRLRAVALTAAGRGPESASELAKAEDPKTLFTATDHFLLGEQARVPAARPEDLRDRTGAFKPNQPALEKAVGQYRLALRTDPGHYWSHFQLGRCLLSLGKPDEGAQALAACIALRPDSPWGYSARGVALTTLKRFDDAAADLERAIALDPDSRLHRMNRGVLHWMRGQIAPALADFDSVLAPPTELQLPEAAFYKAQLYGQEGKLDLALTAANRALVGKTPVRTAYLFRAQLHFLKNRTTEGLDDLNAFFAGGAVGYDPTSAEAAGRRGHQLWLIARELAPGQDKQKTQILLLARTELRDAAAREGGTAAVFEDVGRVAELLGRMDEAIEAYTRALEKNNNDVRTLALRGWAYVSLPKPPLDKARADFAAALLANPEDPESHAGLGYVQACRKVDIEARREAQRAVLFGSGDYLILHNVACVFAKLSEAEPDRVREQEDLALDYLARAVDLWKRDRSGPNELSLIKDEPAFTPSLRARPEFKKLLQNDRP